MDPEVTQIFNFIMWLVPFIAFDRRAGRRRATLNNWLKIKNGYPLSNSWGMPLHPKRDEETTERVRLLTTENAQLRAELGSIKDRLETLERIATDQPSKLARDIDALTIDKGGNA